MSVLTTSYESIRLQAGNGEPGCRRGRCTLAVIKNMLKETQALGSQGAMGKAEGWREGPVCSGLEGQQRGPCPPWTGEPAGLLGCSRSLSAGQDGALRR